VPSWDSALKGESRKVIGLILSINGAEFVKNFTNFLAPSVDKG